MTTINVKTRINKCAQYNGTPAELQTNSITTYEAIVRLDQFVQTYMALLTNKTIDPTVDLKKNELDQLAHDILNADIGNVDQLLKTMHDVYYMHGKIEGLLNR